MKAGSLVSIAVLTSTQLTEVTFVVNELDSKDLTGCLGNNIVIQLEDNAASRHLVDANVKIYVASVTLETWLAVVRKERTQEKTSMRIENFKIHKNKTLFDSARTKKRA